jgi:23S rRNA (pseudouridine1915-N3)-methyltransferase
MRFSIVAIGQRMPSWVVSGWTEYARRFPPGLGLDLNELPAIRRSRNADIDSIRRRESEALLAATPKSSLLIALDENGKQWSTAELSGQMSQWMQRGRDVSFLIGGPDGLSAQCLQRASVCWSLSRLTLPHPLVRVVVAEQLYRAWSVTQNHPYHRT